MTPETIYVKTEKGRDEIRSRAAGLNQALRILLIATDGDKSLGKLSRLHPAGDGTGTLIGQLQALGLVEPLGVSRPVASRAARTTGLPLPETKYVMSLR
ncbi:MAG TPA: hypothetical protein VLI06_21190 [Solimonas sp.]|nr:hypothetical protein [Solimonas sp.]